jgi:hypothetical protein
LDGFVNLCTNKASQNPQRYSSTALKGDIIIETQIGTRIAVWKRKDERYNTIEIKTHSIAKGAGT